jgi:hypothetical protein
VGTRRRLSNPSLGGVAAAALAGLAAGTLLVRSPKPAHAPLKPHPAALPVEIAPAVQTPQAADAAMAHAPPNPAARQAPPPATAVPRDASPHADHAAMRAADRRLRAAYARAVHAGVPRALLAEDRDRWISARRRFANQPERLVAAYDSLARDFDRAAAGPPRGHEGRRARQHHPNVVARLFRWL